MTLEMHEGRIKFVNEEKGFGFINGPAELNQPDGVFFHVKGYMGGNEEFKTLRKGDAVKFSTIPSQKKPNEVQAKTVVLVSRAPKQPVAVERRGEAGR